MNKDTRLTEGKVRKGGLGSMPLTPPPSPPKGQNPMVMNNCPYCDAESMKNDSCGRIIWRCGTVELEKINQRDSQHNSCRIRELEQQNTDMKPIVEAAINFRKILAERGLGMAAEAAVFELINKIDALGKEPSDDR